MGCGSSSENQPPQDKAPYNSKRAMTGNNNENSLVNRNYPGSVPNGRLESGTNSRKKKHRGLGNQTQPPVPKPVAFDIQLDNNNIENILSKHPPKRLKRLEPLKNAPTLSAEMLEEKLRQAEEKRQQQIELRRATSQKMMKARENLQKAKEFEKSQQAHQAAEIEEKLQSAGKNREARLRSMEDKFRLREQRAREARERAKQLKMQQNSLDFDVEKDENFNADDDDNWFDDAKEGNVQNSKSHGQTTESSHILSEGLLVNSSEHTSYNLHSDIDNFFDS